LNLSDAQGTLSYSWSFSAEDIIDTSKDLNLGIVVSAVSNEISGKVGTNNKALSITFEQQGDSPVNASIKVYVGNKFNNADVLCLYNYNSVTKTFTLKQNGVIVKDGYSEIKIDSTSSFVFTSAEIETSTPTDNPTTSDKFNIALLFLLLLVSTMVITDKRNFLNN